MASPFGIPPVNHTSSWRLAMAELGFYGPKLSWAKLEQYCAMGVPGAKAACRKKRDAERREDERERKAAQDAKREGLRIIERAQHKDRRKARNERRSENRRRRRNANNYRKHISKAKRERIYARDDYRCVKCGAMEKLTLDHVQPVLRGGTNADENLQTMCAPCNGRKGNRWEPDLAVARAA